MRPGKGRETNLRERRNIVFITLDAWRYDALGLAPDRHWLQRYDLEGRLHTPNLDRFASQGVYFPQALATAPHTTVSHASLMTGLFPPQHGVRSFFHERLPKETKTLAEILDDHGYLTVALREGEDTSDPGILQKVDVLRGFARVVNSLEDLVLLGREAAAAERPVFAFLHLWDIHAPYTYSDWARQVGGLDRFWAKAHELADRWGVPPPRAEALCEQEAMDFQNRVADAIQDVDARIRALFEWYVEGLNWFDGLRWPAVEAALREAELWDETLIFVFGDHGEGVHPDGQGRDVFNHSQSLLDDVLRVPLVVHGLPGFSDQVVHDQLSLVDLMPTVLELLGTELPDSLASQEMRGRSLLPLLNSGSSLGQRLHFAELCRGGPDFTLAAPSPQYIYQRCARGSGYKAVCHNGPVSMNRYVGWQDQIARKMRAGLRRMGMASGHSSVIVEDGAECDRLHWVDLEEDPDEEHPRRWGKAVPQPVLDLRTALEGLYEDSIRGPAIADDECEEPALRRRLAALGYIED